MQAGKRGRFMKLPSSNVCLMKGCGSPSSNATAARLLAFHLGDTDARGDVLDQSLFIFGTKQLLPYVVPTLERCTAFLKFSGKCTNFLSNSPRTLSAFSLASLASLFLYKVSMSTSYYVVLLQELALGQEHLFSPDRQHVGLSHSRAGRERARVPG